jgi:hypothetical protein
MMTMPVNVQARTATREPARLRVRYQQSRPRHSTHTDGLQRVGIPRTADQKVAAETDPNRRVGAEAAVVAREIAATDPAGRCIHRPGKSGSRRQNIKGFGDEVI